MPHPEIERQTAPPRVSREIVINRVGDPRPLIGVLIVALALLAGLVLVLLSATPSANAMASAPAFSLELDPNGQ